MNTYRTVIAGSRSVDEYDRIVNAIESAPFEIATVISGGANGVDTLGEQWANENGIPVRQYLPEEFEERASDRGMPSPLVRNEKMAEVGEALLAIWDGESRGTKHMVSCAEREGIPVHLVRVDSRRLDEF